MLSLGHMGSCLRVQFIILIMAFLFSAACANKTLIRDSEYQPVYRSLIKNHPDEALLVFPEKEKDGFITTFEKSWIKFWSGEKLSADEVKKVQDLSSQIDQRKFISISHEASVFLIGESEDGYIPSEHEIVSLHLFLSMIYLDRNNLDSAHVELKRAIEYLANNPEGKETTFDDAAIRIWLSGLWEAVGDRNSSDVDLRKAMQLSGNRQIEKLLFQNNRKIKVILNGLGPKTSWSDSGQSFFFDYKPEPYDGVKKDYEFSTRNWYDWHRNRNTKIRENLLISHYMASSLGHKTSRVSQRTASVAFVGAMYTAAAGIFLGGIYLGAQYGGVDPENIIYLAGGLASWIVTKANDLYANVDLKIEESKRNEAELLKTYRMIRFLPSTIEYVDENLAKSKSVSVRGYRKTLGAGNNQVEFIWNPE